jgi:hypothetical protein
VFVPSPESSFQQSFLQLFLLRRQLFVLFCIKLLFEELDEFLFLFEKLVLGQFGLFVYFVFGRGFFPFLTFFFRKVFIVIMFALVPS